MATTDTDMDRWLLGRLLDQLGWKTHPESPAEDEAATDAVVADCRVRIGEGGLTRAGFYIGCIILALDDDDDNEVERVMISASRLLGRRS